MRQGRAIRPGRRRPAHPAGRGIDGRRHGLRAGPRIGALLVELVTVHDVPLASILQGRLLAQGIDAELFDSGFSGLLGGGYPGIRVMVPADDCARARRLPDLPEKKAVE
ncbi:MAG: putative signal transducing protein [Sandaracinobacter sp.]